MGLSAMPYRQWGARRRTNGGPPHRLASQRLVRPLQRTRLEGPPSRTRSTGLDSTSHLPLCFRTNPHCFGFRLAQDLVCLEASFHRLLDLSLSSFKDHGRTPSTNVPNQHTLGQLISSNLSRLEADSFISFDILTESSNFRCFPHCWIPFT